MMDFNLRNVYNLFSDKKEEKRRKICCICKDNILCFRLKVIYPNLYLKGEMEGSGKGEGLERDIHIKT